MVLFDQKKKEIGEILAISRSEARRREKTSQNPPVLALRFFPELGVYVAVYEADAIRDAVLKDSSGS